MLLSRSRSPARRASLLALAALTLLAIGPLIRALPAQGGRAVGSGAGAPAQPTVLSLGDALRLAERRSPALAQVDARGETTRGDVRAVGQWPNPVLEYRRENLGAPLQPDEFVTAYIPVDVTGRRLQLARATRQGTARAEAERRAARRDVALEIARAWLSAALSADVFEALRVRSAATDTIAAMEAERAREGLSPEAASLRTRVEADRVAFELVQAETARQRDRASLAVLLGVPPDSLPPLPSLRDGETATDVGALLADTAWRALAALDEAALQARAMAGRDELRAADLAREEAALRLRVERGGVLGDWQLQGGSKRTGGFLTGQVGLAVPLPLFNRNGGARERAAGASREADAAWQATALTVAADVRTAVGALRRLEQVATRLRTTPDDGATVAASAQVAYREGHMTLLELLDAQRVAGEAQVTALQSRAALLLARWTLARAVGLSLLPEDGQ